MPRVSTLDHWESYWKGHQQDIDDTYSTGGRLVREVLADGPVAGKLVMEIGAGSGRDLLELARLGARGVVLDYSPASLALVKQQAISQAIPVMFVQADATRMPFRDGAIDISFHQGLLEHVRDPMPLLRENARITRAGGRVLVDVPQTYHLY
jgi:ubiquinone/menaquinone biosynthesis C-methylase UbiE